MKNVFVDTNVLIDLLGDRVPFSRSAIELFDLAEKKKVRLYTSSHSYATTHYVLRKEMGEQQLLDLLYSTLDYLDLIAIDTSIIKESVLSNHGDFEDAIQIFAAKSIQVMDIMVTRDKDLENFKDAGIKILPTEEAIQCLFE